MNPIDKLREHTESDGIKLTCHDGTLVWGTITMGDLRAILAEHDRLTAENVNLRTQVSDMDAELEAHATDRVNQRAEVIRLTADDLLLRRMLWLRHGCQGLYGDDGEMQCGSCFIDFKREPIQQIDRRLREIGLRKMVAESCTTPLTTPPASDTLAGT